MSIYISLENEADLAQISFEAIAHDMFKCKGEVQQLKFEALKNIDTGSSLRIEIEASRNPHVFFANKRRFINRPVLETMQGNRLEDIHLELFSKIELSKLVLIPIYIEVYYKQGGTTSNYTYQLKFISNAS